MRLGSPVSSGPDPVARAGDQAAGSDILLDPWLCALRFLGEEQLIEILAVKDFAFSGLLDVIGLLVWFGTQGRTALGSRLGSGRSEASGRYIERLWCVRAPPLFPFLDCLFVRAVRIFVMG